MSTTVKAPRLRGKLPPGPRGGLLLGNTLAYMKDPLGFLEQAVRTHGDIVKLRLGNLRTYLLVRPQHIEYVLRTHHENFIKDKLTQTISPLVGQGLLTSEGTFWKRQRRLAQPAFQHQQIQRYAAQMVEQTQRMLETFFNPMRWFRIREHLPLPSTREYWRAIRRIDEIIYRLIRERRETGHDHDDLLSHLLQARDQDGGAMTDTQLRDEAVTILLAGHETTALALFYAFYLLAGHPEVQARLDEELTRVLGGRPPTAADVPNLPYSEWVFRETMRLYPPAWGIAREAVGDCEIGGYLVPRGTQLFLTQYLVHRDPRWYDKPEAFLPERWAGDLVKRLPRCAYFPFGDGPRVCIGNHFAMMKGILVLVTIAQRYRLSILPDQTLELLPSITLRPRSGLRVRLHRRNEPAA